jgi:DNA-binding response OmpR family regulator
MSQRIYIIDDEPDMAKAAAMLLEDDGFVVRSATNPDRGLEEIKKDPPDVVLLDIRMPKKNGYEVCRQLKSDPKTKQVPIVMVSVKQDETDVVLGLELGASDYIRKPYFEKELLVRIKKVLQQGQKTDDSSPFKIGPFEVDPKAYTVKASGKKLDLTGKEFELFQFFLKREGHVLTRDAISKHVWGLDDPRTSRTIDFHAHQLRKKLGPHGVFIKALKGIGYRFEIE